MSTRPSHPASRTPLARDRAAATAAAIGLAAVALACGAASGDDPGVTGATAAAGTTRDAFAWPDSGGETAVIEVAGHGEIRIELYRSLAPKAVENFLALADDDFYRGTTFHRVMPGFMIQGGDPNSRDADPANDGQGGPGYLLEDEFSDAPHVRGVVAMANAGRDKTSGSQFFIVQQDAPHLDGHFSAFGRVVSGMDVVDAIASAETDVYGRWGPKNRPIERIEIERVWSEGAMAESAGPPPNDEVAAR